MSKIYKVKMRYRPGKGWSYGRNPNYFEKWWNAYYMGLTFREF